MQVHDIVITERPGALADVRRALVELVGPGADPASVDDALLVASELVANAQEFGGEATCRLRVARLDPDVVRLEVIDASPLRPPVSAGARSVPEEAESGRGLLLVAGIALRWGSGPHRLGKCVWAELALPPGPGTRGGLPVASGSAAGA